MIKELQTRTPDTVDWVRWEEKQSELIEAVADKITISPDMERFIFIGVANRTATGSLTTAMGRIPVEPAATRHIQPVKAIARRIMSEEGVGPSTPLTFLKDEIEIGSGVQIVKETVGPDVMNPGEWLPAFEMFLERGVDPNKAAFVPTIRSPLDTMTSWMKMWGWGLDNFPFGTFNASFRITAELMDLAQSNGVQVVPYVHELTRDYGADANLSRMCETLGLPYSDNVVNWQNGSDPYWQGNIVKYDVPPNAWIQGSLSVTHGGRGGLIWQPIDAEYELSGPEIDYVLPRIGEAIQIYTEVRERTENLLGLDN